MKDVWGREVQPRAGAETRPKPYKRKMSMKASEATSLTFNYIVNIFGKMVEESDIFAQIKNRASLGRAYLPLLQKDFPKFWKTIEDRDTLTKYLTYLGYECRYSKQDQLDVFWNGGLL